MQQFTICLIQILLMKNYWKNNFSFAFYFISLISEIIFNSLTIGKFKASNSRFSIVRSSGCEISQITIMRNDKDFLILGNFIIFYVFGYILFSFHSSFKNGIIFFHTFGEIQFYIFQCYLFQIYTISFFIILQLCQNLISQDWVLYIFYLPSLFYQTEIEKLFQFRVIKSFFAVKNIANFAVNF
ncbi:hypothetical protein PPERSA_03339 [Pseudocohnilembus persalinus]|uniref:Transmembrane protein n=1 Tax=Pseudocohnilembus persalinus TaxID=266149 RepID=A0A0V0R1E7_PSEPJ|nr:hypothetical protein PPERSA_03339 [Pseudocohnilembus persalinus]|eukprot:KRX08345.1 hypothetical protein PPERSA_03339 [Pseudocohnilembus persalinus]